MKMAGDKLHTWRSLDSTSKECGGCVLSKFNVVNQIKIILPIR